EDLSRSGGTLLRRALRHDEGRSGEEHRGKLVAQRLAAASGHDANRVAAVENRLDDLLVARRELVEAGQLPPHSVNRGGRGARPFFGHRPTSCNGCASAISAET